METLLVETSEVRPFTQTQATAESLLVSSESPNVDPVSDATAATWKGAVALKQAQLSAAFPKEWLIPASVLRSTDLSLTSTTDLTKTNIVQKCNIMTDRELAITENYNARQLLANMANCEMTALEVTVAFSKRAAIAQQLARERALFLDAHLRREGKVYGPLHGLPISLKDSFDISGVQSTIGYVSFLSHPVPTSNAALVDVLLRLGAVLYVKTNIPQTMMTADSENNIFGRTRNPRKLNLTAGGSSGGEGSLVAFRGAILGVGTDVAGSIRIPSLCCGTYGFKPTANRVPFGGQASPAMPGLPGILPSAGPLATCVADMELFFQYVLGARPWTDDASAFAVPYQTIASGPFMEAEKGVLTIGILPEDPSLPWHPPVRRALENAVSVLNAAGHTMVQIPLSFATSASKAWDLAYKFFSLDPNHTGIQHIRDSGEPMIKTVAANWEAADNEAFHRKYTILDLAAMNVERTKYFEAWREAFVTNKFDVVIAPVAQHTAVKHDMYGLPGYTTIWNLLDYPVCVIPYGQSSMSLDSANNPEVAIRGPPYDAVAFDGAPTAIQVIAPRFRDELCLAASKMIDQALNQEKKA